MIRRFALAALLALTACVAASPLPARAQTFLESTTPPLETKADLPPPGRQPSRNFVLGRDLNIINAALVELRDAVKAGGGGGGGGNAPVVTPKTWAFTGNGSSTDVALAGADVTTTESYVVTLDGVVQTPTTDYAVNASADTITFTVAPPDGAAGVVRLLGYVRAMDSAVSITDFNAIPDDGVNDRAAIQAAIDATPSGGTLLVPAGVFDLAGAGSELLLVAGKPITIRCSGWGASKLRVAASVGASTDVIRHTGPSEGFKIEDCQIVPASGTPARHGLNLDATSAYNGERMITRFIIAHNWIGPFGGKALATTFPTQIAGVFNGVFRENYFRGGVDLTRAGDTLTFRDNTFDLKGPAIYVDLVYGSSKLLIDHNSMVSCDGLVVIAHGTRTTIANNNLEPSIGCAPAANGAVIDLRGSADDVIENATIRDNLFSINDGTGLYHVRADWAYGTKLEGNTFAIGNAAQRNLYTTANALDTFWGANEGYPHGVGLQWSIEDHGTRTISAFPHNGQFTFGELPTNTSPTQVKVKCRTGQTALPFSVVNDVPNGGIGWVDSHLLDVGCDGTTTLWNESAGGATTLLVKGGAGQAGHDFVSLLKTDGSFAFGVGYTGSVELGQGAQVMQRDSSGANVAIAMLNPANNAVVVGSLSPTTPASAGTSIMVDGTTTALFRDRKLSLFGPAFSGLGAATAPAMTWCSDCAIATPCAGGGSGAWAFANGSQWACPF